MKYRKGILIVTEEPAITESRIHSHDIEIRSISVSELVAAPDPWRLLRGHKYDRVLLPETLKEPWAAMTMEKVRQGVMPTVMHHGDYKERIVYY